MDEAMVPLYVRLIQGGRRTIDQVPERLRDRVQVALDGDK